MLELGTFPVYLLNSFPSQNSPGRVSKNRAQNTFSLATRKHERALEQTLAYRTGDILITPINNIPFLEEEGSFLIILLIKADTQSRNQRHIHSGCHNYRIRLLVEEKLPSTKQLAIDLRHHRVRGLVDNIGLGIKPVALHLQDVGTTRGRGGEGGGGFRAQY